MASERYNLPPHRRGDDWSGIGTIQFLRATGVTLAPVASAAANTLTLAAHGLANGAILRIDTTAKGIPARRRLYVVNAATNTFQLALTPAGSAIDLTADGAVSLAVYAPPASPLNVARGQLRFGSPRGGKAIDLDIEIDSADDWIITVPPQAGPDLAGEWHYDIETVDEAGAIWTPLYGILTVADDVTRISAP